MVRLLDAEIRCGTEGEKMEIAYAAASDLMSDVLTIHHDNMTLLTGLANLQTIRTAEMSDIHCVVLLRGKKASPEMAALAEENQIVLIESPHTMFKACGVLYAAGIKPVY